MPGPRPGPGGYCRPPGAGAGRRLPSAACRRHDGRWRASVAIDGTPVEFRKAWTAVRAAHGTFVGFYADVSHLLPDHPYQFQLTLPALERGQFLGLYFENVEPDMVSGIAGP